MNDSCVYLPERGDFSSSVDPSQHNEKAVDAYMKRHGHPPFPVTWRPYNKGGQSLDTYLAGLEYFYRMYNGMEVLHEEVNKSVILTYIPSELIVLNMQDQIFDTKACRRGETCLMREDQQEGLKGRNMDTVTGLLLHTMSECYFKKREIIDKVEEIQRWHKRFSEFSAEELTEIETSLEKRNEEFPPTFEECLARMKKEEMIAGYQKTFIGFWKLKAMFLDNESKQVEKMDGVTRKYWETINATQEKNDILSTEIDKLRAKCTTLDKKISEHKASTSKHKKDAEYYKKLSEQLQKKLKETDAKSNDLLQANKSFQQINYDIQKSRAEMETNISLLQEDRKRLESANKQALEREMQYKTEVQSLKSEMSKLENILKQLEDKNTNMKTEFEAVKATKENLLTRLSEVAGTKLTEGNTEITDLSDPNRPTKIGEAFREVYDNQWTEALEELTAKHVGVSDRMAVEFLLNVMMKSFRFCSETLKIQADNCYRCFEEFPAPRSKDLQVSMGVSETIPTISLKESMRKRIDGIRKGVIPAMKPVAKQRCLANIEIQLRMLVHQVSDYNVAEIQSQAAGLNTINEDDHSSSSNEAHGMPQEQGYTTDSLNQSWKQGKCQEKTITTEENTEVQNLNSSNAVSESFEFRSSHSSSPNGNSQQAFNESEDDKKKDSAQDRNNVDRDCRKYNLLNDPKSPSMDKDGDVNISSADELRTETEVSVPSNGSRYVEMSLVHDSKSKALDEEIVKTNEKHSENEDSYKRNENQSENGGVEQSGKKKSRKISDSDEMEAAFKELSKVLNFSGKCFDLCWLMRTHSPELHLDEQIQKGSEFDPNRFRHYTQTGKKVEFVVWPALHLYEGGPLLAKGVAQPIKDKNKNNSAQQQT